MTQTLTTGKQRIASIDILRGAIMLIMALDHVRDFFHSEAMTGDPVNLATTTPVLFFTRWITHYCAPLFVFLSGISAFISGQRKTKTELSNFLLKRGFWLVLVELIIVTLGITFNPLYNVIVLQVIWAIGWSMIVLGLLVRGSTTLVAIVGVIIFFGHNLLDYVSLPKEGAGFIAMQMLLTSPGAIFPYAPDRVIFDAYAVLPWTGIMLMGYVLGSVVYKSSFDEIKRRRILLRLGVGLILLFIILRFPNIYGDPGAWSTQKNNLFTFLSFINVTKYPVSLQYACMTLGPALILLSLLEKVQGKFADFLLVYGRVPFFYYVIHFYLIHTLCVIAFFATGHGIDQAIDRNTPFLFRPQHFGFSLVVVYLVWLSVILSLYYPSRWFMRYKQTHRQWWLSYV